MRDFICPNCGQRLAFENSMCLSCKSRLGFSLEQMAFLVIADDDGEQSGSVPASEYQLCANLLLAECNWLVPVEPVRRLCQSCVLTRTRPDDADTKALAAFAAAEKAKRRLIAELHELKLPIVGRDADPERGLVFDLLSSEQEQVFTGHDDGVITLDLAEGDDVHREQLRISMDEPYRTLLGHFRHEIGHYYHFRLVGSSGKYVEEFTELFGDHEEDYQAALDRHYSQGPPKGWEQDFVRPTPPCIPPRTGPRRSRTTCTSATRSTRRRRSASPRRGRPMIDGFWGPAVLTLSSRCGCRWRGR